MSEFTAHSEIPVGSERSFGYVFAAVFTLVGLWPLTNGDTLRLWAILVGSIFLLAAVLSPTILRPLNRLWFTLGILLGTIVSPVVMFVVFAMAVTPTAVLARVLRKDLLRLKIDRRSATYWIRRHEDAQGVSSMRNQF